MLPELEQYSENFNYEKIELLKNKVIAWDKNLISNGEFSIEVKVLIQEGIIIIPFVDLDNLDAYDLNTPTLMKKTANFWIRDSISDLEFINAIEYVLESNLEGSFSSYG